MITSFSSPHTTGSSDRAPILRQAYISRSSSTLSKSEIDELEQISKERSERLGLKNLIVVLDGRVIQIMEGPEKRVRRIMKRIVSDKAHHQFVNLFSSHSEQRPLLREASVVVRDLSEVPEDMMEQLRQLATCFQWAHSNPALSSADVGFLKSLAIFAFKREDTPALEAQFRTAS